MLLAADIGNTSITIGIFPDGSDAASPVCKPGYRFKLSSAPNKSDDEYAASIMSILNLNGVDYKQISAIIIGSVVPYLSGILQSALSKLFDCNMLIVGSGIKTGLDIKIDNPSQLGADIVANCAAVSARYKLPAIIFDFGTATTVSAINAGNVFCGTAIIPGLRMSVDALADSAALLSFVKLDTPSVIIGKNSQSSVLSGVVNGAAILTDGFIDKIKKDQNMQSATIIATGGLAKYVLPLCSHNIISEPNLTLIGLLQLYKINTVKRQR